ncbi:MAG: MBL fold metallo-hydrolase [Lachnospiraceae bacterium]|nr:MBL fold metallo-hydrolase [Lachnospiraceae bacterium]
MILEFIGAAHEVTGSCHYLNVNGKNILVDYGMEQGKNLYENVDLPVSAGEIDYIFLTHAHIDHSGLLPYAYAKGFRGRIYATNATAKLCSIMLRDSAHIQAFEAEWRNRKARRNTNIEEFVPLYTMEDADGAIRLLKPVSYNELIHVDQGIDIRFTDVGHLLGSAAIEVFLNEEGVSKKIVFSGDVGNTGQPILREPQPVEGADYVLIESTYGDRLHSEEKPDYIGELTKILQFTFDRGGNVVIPSFAVGRTQELLYFIREIKEKGLVHGHEDFPVYVDSPLAVDATSIFGKSSLECYDGEAKKLVEKGINPLSFTNLNLSITPDDSRDINTDDEPKVIISASGMCDAGRIRHHLKHNLWRKESTILFVGYQSAGTLGRALYEGARTVKLFGEEISVNASIEILTGMSGHADQKGLLNWAEKSFDPEKTQKIFVVHGEDTVTDKFAALLTEKFGFKTYAPYSGTKYDLLKDEVIEETKGIPVVKKVTAQKKISTVFERLLAAGERLLSVIRKNEHGANKDLAKFADQINALSDKWDRT